MAVNVARLAQRTDMPFHAVIRDFFAITIRRVVIATKYFGGFVTRSPASAFQQNSRISAAVRDLEIAGLTHFINAGLGERKSSLWARVAFS